ncbi:MAG: MFS transporter [Deltaproteobacteria bacterium]|nr:MFS transporter [Deltaproteobacteria bacterium]
MNEAPFRQKQQSKRRRLSAWVGRAFPALEEHDFRVLWLGMLPGILAQQMFFFVNGYFAFELTGVASSIGVVSVGFGLPMLLFSLLGGMTADRYSKLRLLIITEIVLVTGAVIMALLVLSDFIRLWHMVMIGAVMGTAFTFHMPARQSFFAEVISQPRLMNAIALGGAGTNASRVLGPPLAGMLIGVAWIGVGGVYVLIAVMYALVFLGFLNITEPGGRVERDGITGFRSMIDGVAYIRNNPVLPVLLALSLAPIMLGLPYQALMPVFAKKVFHVGPGGLGMLMMVNGIGALVGSLVIASLRNLQRPGLVQLTLGMLFGLSLVVFSSNEHYLVALIMLFFVGGVSAAYLSLNASLIMQKSDSRYHGRVMSIYMLTFSALPLGNMFISLLADAFGAPATIGTGGTLTAVIVFLFGSFSRAYRNI